MEYLLLYLGIGLLVVFWDFRKYGKIVFWRIRYRNIPDYAATLAYGHQKPKVDFWNMPGYIRQQNWLLAILFVFLWPLRLSSIFGLTGFIRNLRAGRIHLRGQGRSAFSKIKLEQPSKIYENIVSFFVVGGSKQEWLEFRCDGKTIVIHDGKIFYEKMPEDLGCPEGAKHSLYLLKRTQADNGKTVWEVDEAHNPFKVRMAGYGSRDSYEEDDQGNITHIEQKENWIS